MGSRRGLVTGAGDAGEVKASGIVEVLACLELRAAAVAADGVGAEACGVDHADAVAWPVLWDAEELAGADGGVVSGGEVAIVDEFACGVRLDAVVVGAFAGQVETVGLALAVRAVARNVAAGCGWCAEPEGGVVDCPDGDGRAVLRGDCDLGCSERSVPHGVELPLDGFGVGQVPEGIGGFVGCDFVELCVRIVAGVGSEQERGLGFV